MKIKLLVVVAVATLASSAMAQSAFQGFYGQISTGYESNSATGINSPLTLSDGVRTEVFGSISASNQNFGGMPLIAGLGYNFSVTPKWLIGIGADYSFLTQESSSFATNSNIGPGLDGTLNGAKLKASNRLNIFITPGYSIDKDKLVYLKAGYSSVKVDDSAPSSSTQMGITTPVTGTSQSKTLNGYVLGVGYKQIISGGFYGFAEANYMNYGKQSFTTTYTDREYSLVTNPSIGLSSYQFLVGVGYKF